MTPTEARLHQAYKERHARFRAAAERYQASKAPPAPVVASPPLRPSDELPRRLPVEPARKTRSDRYVPSSHDKARFDKIVGAVAAHYKMGLLSLMNSRRHEDARARAVAMYIVREVIGMPFSAMGYAFKRDHTTALVSCQRVADAMLDNAVLRNEVNDLIQQVLT